MHMVRQFTHPVCVRLDFLETFVRSPLTAVSLTPALTAGTVRVTAWPSRASVHTVSVVLRVTTPPASHPALEGRAATGERVSVNLMELSGAFARNGSRVPRVPCSRVRRSESWR